VECNTGLGDAVAQSLGGVVYRLAPGVPPFGKLKKISHDEKDVVICILGNPIKTSNILNSARIRTGINNAGSKALLEFSKNGFFSDFTRLSWNFAIKSGLATKKMEKALSSISGVGEGSMVMLGNAVFAFGDSIELASRLKLFGSVFKTHNINTFAILLLIGVLFRFGQHKSFIRPA
jgi:pantoate kinase